MFKRGYLFLALVLAMIAAPGHAAPRYVVAAVPVIESLTVEDFDDLSAGTDLEFTLEGTPRGRASLRIPGIPRTIPMREVDPGVYEASYTIKKKDRIAGHLPVRATLKVGRYSTTAQMSQRLVAAPQAQPTPRPRAPGALIIERFTVAPVERIEPGTEMRFTVTGTPSARASFTIEGVAANIPMSETRPGTYEGRYTIRRQDNFPPGVDITATLQAEGQVVRSRLEQAFIQDREPPVVRNVQPKEGDLVWMTPRFVISGTFEDGAGAGVDPRTVRILVDGRDVTSSADITPQFFSYRPRNLPVGAHRVEVSARDYAGNAMRSAWSFQTQAHGEPPSSQLYLDVLAPANNSAVGRGPIQVRGKTAPNAVIEAEVTATASVAGLFGVNQGIYKESLRADHNGNFSFSFNPPILVAGARYEISLTAAKDNQTRDTKLFVIQR